MIRKYTLKVPTLILHIGKLAFIVKLFIFKTNIQYWGENPESAMDVVNVLYFFEAFFTT